MLIPYDGILFDLKMYLNTDICYNIVEHWKHYDEREKKTDTKGCVLYDSPLKKMLIIGKSTETECRLLIP